MRKYTFEEIGEFIKDLGFELLNKSYNNACEKLELKDSEEYLYTAEFRSLSGGYKPSKFNKKNYHTISNIITWCKINNKYKDFELISDKYEGNNKKLQWKCLKSECGEIFGASWANISKGNGCPFCAGKQVGLSNCLATKNPELASEWHPTLNGNLTPYDVTCGIDKEVWWQCKDNPKHEWKARINNRNNGSNCPDCSKRLVTVTNNLFIVNPKLCNEWDYSKNDGSPELYAANSHIKVWWICSKNSEHKLCLLGIMDMDVLIVLEDYPQKKIIYS